MWKNFFALAKGPLLWVLPYVCCGALIVGAYWFGGHNQRVQDGAVDTAVTNATGQLQKQMADLTNGFVGNINTQLSEGISHAVSTLQQNQTSIDAQYANFNLSPNAGVLVEGAVPASDKASTVSPASCGPGSNGAEYRAKLSATSEGFFRGEAHRADQAATDLIYTKSTIREWQRAVDNYNRTVADPNQLPRVKLPVDMSGTAYEKK